MKTLILGLGNPILGDDGVGLLIAGLVGKQLPPNMLIEVGQETCGGLRLMERLAGFDKAIIVDAIHTGTHPPGTLHHLKLNDINTQHSASVHDVNLPTAIQLGKTIGIKMPDDIRIIAIEAENTLDFVEGCSPDVAAAVPQAVKAVLSELSA
ncbi:MAG: hydrogenase maturation protease [Chloroflexi bacterium]|nr:hydrogenase maturation protease [Chloroflexota bacterium]MBP8054585.1 hydrogenase maturation protease [Chloroflexota bacterium]